MTHTNVLSFSVSLSEAAVPYDLSIVNNLVVLSAHRVQCGGAVSLANASLQYTLSELSFCIPYHRAAAYDKPRRYNPSLHMRL